MTEQLGFHCLVALLTRLEAADGPDPREGHHRGSVDGVRRIATLPSRSSSDERDWRGRRVSQLLSYSSVH